MTIRMTILGTALTAALFTTPASAHENGMTGTHATGHAPIGVMADHRHNKGEWMLSYRYMNMDMNGNRDGSNSLTPDIIATRYPNAFAGQSGQPPTLRVVPLDMNMDMHMIGAMYAISDKITLMGMTNYLETEMNHRTYMGGMGTMVRGHFQTATSGFGDTTLGAIIGLDDGNKAGHQFNASLSISLPTGSITQTDQILTPMGSTPTPRLPYPMQLGTGTYDLKPSLTYFDRAGRISWGGQANARIALNDNDEGYKYGNRFEATAWLAYEPEYWLSLSARLKASTQDAIDGQDPLIKAPVQTADTNNYGGETVEALIGANIAFQRGVLKDKRIAFEYGLPLSRDLNGPQLETDSTLTIGLQLAFK